MSYFVEQGPVALMAGFTVMHALADYPLQGDYIAKQKSRANADSTSVLDYRAHRPQRDPCGRCLAGFRVLAYAVAELILHAVIDVGKGEGKFGLVTDQLLHLACKVLFVILLALGVGVA